jgi:hypothetical protein
MDTRLALCQKKYSHIGRFFLFLSLFFPLHTLSPSIPSDLPVLFFFTLVACTPLLASVSHPVTLTLIRYSNCLGDIAIEDRTELIPTLCLLIVLFLWLFLPLCSRFRLLGASSDLVKSVQATVTNTTSQSLPQTSP